MERFDRIFINDLHFFIASQPYAVRYANGAAIGTRLYIAGGYYTYDRTTSLQIFDSVTSTWRLGPSMPTAVEWHSSAASDSKVSV